MQPFFGQPVKNIELTVSGQRSRGEFVITQSGVEGTNYTEDAYVGQASNSR